MSRPKISGTAKVGSTLTAKPGTWTSKTTFSYQWYANGKAISKATKVTYKIPKSLDFHDGFPMTGSGKIAKKDLRAPYWSSEGRSVA
mgnify:CR=1 FL=1